MEPTETIENGWDEKICGRCGYDLRAASSDRCPECGSPVDSVVARVPWENRRAIGAVRAYLQTVSVVMFRPARLARAAAGPMNLIDARRFRAITFNAATAGVLVAGIVIARARNGWVVDRMTHHPWICRAEWLTAATAAAGVWPAMACGCGLAEMWMRPTGRSSRQHERAIAVGFYATAPLVNLAVVAMAATLIYGGSWSPDRFGLLVTAAGIVVGGLALFTTALSLWIGPTYLARKITRGGLGPSILMLTALPVGWFVSVVVCVGLPPLAVLYLGVMLRSL